jgi:hypothetical protein
MDEGKSTVRVARKNLRMTHSTNLPESDIITFCLYCNDFFFCGRHFINNTKILYEYKIKLYITSLLLKFHERCALVLVSDGNQ